MSKLPKPAQIREMVKSDTFKWFIDRVATRVNELDTVRDIGQGDFYTAQVRRKAIELLEAVFGDVIEAGELQNYQRKIAENEINAVKSLQSLANDSDY